MLPPTLVVITKFQSFPLHHHASFIAPPVHTKRDPLSDFTFLDQINPFCLWNKVWKTTSFPLWPTASHWPAGESMSAWWKPLALLKDETAYIYQSTQALHKDTENLPKWMSFNPSTLFFTLHAPCTYYGRDFKASVFSGIVQTSKLQNTWRPYIQRLFYTDPLGLMIDTWDKLFALGMRNSVPNTSVLIT